MPFPVGGNFGSGIVFPHVDDRRPHTCFNASAASTAPTKIEGSFLHGSRPFVSSAPFPRIDDRRPHTCWNTGTAGTAPTKAEGSFFHGSRQFSSSASVPRLPNRQVTRSMRVECVSELDKSSYGSRKQAVRKSLEAMAAESEILREENQLLQAKLDEVKRQRLPPLESSMLSKPLNTDNGQRAFSSWLNSLGNNRKNISQRSVEALLQEGNSLQEENELLLEQVLRAKQNAKRPAASSSGDNADKILRQLGSDQLQSLAEDAVMVQNVRRQCYRSHRTGRKPLDIGLDAVHIKKDDRVVQFIFKESIPNNGG